MVALLFVGRIRRNLAAIKSTSCAGESLPTRSSQSNKVTLTYLLLHSSGHKKSRTGQIHRPGSTAVIRWWGLGGSRVTCHLGNHGRPSAVARPRLPAIKPTP